jgi:cell wall-associated NlpC family hydrolase
MPGAGAPGAAGILLAASLTLTACVSQPPRPAPPPPAPDTGDAIAALAVSLVGSPYQFGGADAAGFDCSGLALYVYEQSGLAIPRTAREQQRAARPVAPDELAPGDLVFFHIHSGSVDHVGIYTGAGRFIHSPRAGSAVAYGELSSGYYRRHFSSAGRFWGSASRVSPQ